MPAKDNPQEHTTSHHIEPDLIICRKDSHETVLYQNKHSQDKCGHLEGQSCTQCPSPKNLAHPSSDIVRLHDKTYSRMNLPDKTSHVTVMAERHERTPDLMALTQKHALSKRETEIAQLLLDGHSNAQIIEKLVISKSTLKTHLNTIYKKAPSLQTFRESLQL
jgi:DNA-binding CsgD family transcriptional regulator